MSRAPWGRGAALALAAALGLIGGGAVGLVAHDAPRAAIPGPPSPSSSFPTLRPVEVSTLLAWTPGGLPPGFALRVRDLPAVANVVAVVSGTVWLASSASAMGTPVDHPPTGLAIPLELAGADPGAYAPFLAPEDRAILPALAAGGAALGETSARLRHLGPGAVMRLDGRTIRVSGLLPDPAVGAHELFVSRRTAAALGVTRERYLLIEPEPGSSRAALTRAIRAALPAGTPLRVRGPGETPVFRQGDAVLPQVREKDLFGEFAARPLPGGYLRVDPAWERAHIVTAAVPILGVVRCNRAIIPQLRGALDELERLGEASLIDAGDYGGCYSPRFLNRNPAAGISHHAWGVALDINVGRNPFGHTPQQDPRLVAVFQRWGFTWGGDWLVPDGMHFEFVRFTPGD